jgi:hypothetical protein
MRLGPGCKGYSGRGRVTERGGRPPRGGGGGPGGPDTRSVFFPGILREISRVPRGAGREPAGIPGEVSRCPGGLGRDCPAGSRARRRPVAAPSRPRAVPGPGKIGDRGENLCRGGRSRPRGAIPGGPGAAGTAAGLRLNVSFFKRLTCNHRIFIDKKYKSPILEQWVVIIPG